MNKAVVFGFGKYFIENERSIRDQYEIIGIVDNDSMKKGWNYKGISISSPEIIPELQYDVVIIATQMGKSQILRQLCQDLSVSVEKIRLWFEEGSLGEDHYTTKILLNDDNIPKVRFEVFAKDREPLEFILEESGEFLIFEEWFCLNEYRIDAKDGFDVIDIGMNVGMATLYYASMKNVYNVYGFEPFVKTFSKARRNIEMNESISNKIETYNIALSDHEAEEQYEYNDEYPGAMSLLRKQANEGSANASRIKVCHAATVLKPIIEGVDNRKRDLLLKIDCEGSEYVILEDLKKNNLIRSPRYYVMETHFGRHDEAVDLLKENGYIVFSHADKELGMIYAARM